jgi:hypothetical protein
MRDSVCGFYRAQRSQYAGVTLDVSVIGKTGFLQKGQDFIKSSFDVLFF